MTAVLPDVAPGATSSPAAPRPAERDAAVPGAGWLAVGAVASKTAQTAVLLAFAAVLEPNAFGVISLGAVLLNATTVLADLGTATALVHFRGDAERAARTSVTIALTTSLGVVLVAWAAAPELSRFLHVGGLGTTVFRGIVLCTPFAAVAGVSGELLRRALEFRRRVLPDIVGSVVGAGLAIGALALGQGALALVYGQLGQAVVVLLLFWWLRPPVRPGWSGPDASALVSYGAGLAGGGLLTLAMLNVDYVLVANRLGAADVGVYSMAFRVAYMPYLLIAMVIGGALFARLCRLRGPAVWRATLDAAVVLHAWVVPAYVAVLVLAPALQLLGPEWAPAVPALRWLAGYGLTLSALELLLVCLKSVGRTADVLGLAALHFGILVVLLLRYVDRGVTAVAVAQFAAGAVTLATACVVVAARVPGAGAPVGRRAGVRTLGRGRRRNARAAVLAGAGAFVAATACGAAAVAAPRLALGGLLVLAAVGAAVLRVEWAAVAYVALEPWGDLLRDLHPQAIKIAGALLFASWLVRLARDPRPAALRHPAVVALAALMLALLASFVVHGADLATGLDHTITYASYALVVVVLVDTVRRGRPTPLRAAERLGLAFALSCTAAAAVALVEYLAHGGRAAGPLADPNDLAFFLVAALPLLLLGGRRWMLPRALCAAVLIAATVATFSRGAMLALAVMAIVAVLTGAVRRSALLGVCLAAAVAVGTLWATHADLVDESIAEKDHIAAANVDSRVVTATMAARMTAASPLLGQGPGGFAAERSRFVPAGVARVDQAVAHEMYLDVSAELGLLGLGAFLATIGYAVRGALRARHTASRTTATAVLVALAGTLTAALFLSEQFYLPVWLLVALAVALDPEPTVRLRRW